MEFPHDCAEQTFDRYYANALARHLATTHPQIRRIFDLWKNTPALDSPLTKITRSLKEHAGIYQTGIAEIRCMYAPEFSAHSASIRLEVTR